MWESAVADSETKTSVFLAVRHHASPCYFFPLVPFTCLAHYYRPKVQSLMADCRLQIMFTQESEAASTRGRVLAIAGCTNSGKTTISSKLQEMVRFFRS